MTTIFKACMIAVAGGLTLGAAILSGSARAEEPAKPATAAAAPATPAAPAAAPATPATPPATPAATGAAPPPAAGSTSGSSWNAEIAPDKKAGLTLDPAQTEIIKKVSDYFESLNSLKGAFVQTGADQKRLKGKFFLQRPGKFRFDYSLPSKQIIISDGEYLAIQDLDLNNEDRVELDKTPFRLLLRKDVDLARDAKILEVQSADDLIVVALRDNSPDTPGIIKLFLSSAPGMELREWQTIDAQGQQTNVQVSELVKGAELDAELFKIKSVASGGLAKP